MTEYMVGFSGWVIVEANSEDEALIKATATTPNDVQYEILETHDESEEE